MKFQNPLQGFFSFLYIFIIQTFPDQKKGSDVDDHQLDPGGTSSLRWEWGGLVVNFGVVIGGQ